MENVSFALFYRIYLLALITMRLLILKILCWVESLISIFNFLCKSAIFIYYPVYHLSFLLSKKILSCSLRFIKFLVLCTLRLIILFFTYLFYFEVLFYFIYSFISVFWFLTWVVLVSVVDVNISCNGRFH